MHICKKVGSPLCRINHDTANMVLYSGLYHQDEIKTCSQYVSYVPLNDKDGESKDWNFPADGKSMGYLESAGCAGPYFIGIEYTQDFCMGEKDQPGDPEVVNQAVRDSCHYLKQNRE